MKRRHLLGAGAALLAAPCLVRAQSRTTLKFVPYADLALLDPAVSAFVTRNHVMMVYDTLFALDESGTPQPQMLAGHTVDEVSTDWGTVVQRSASRQPLDKGGWNMFASFTGGIDAGSPGSDNLLRGNGDRAYNGWPTAPKLEALRDEWLSAPPDRQLDLARQIQLQAWEDVPFLPLGSYDQPTAYRADLVDMLKGLILFTSVRRA